MRLFFASLPHLLIGFLATDGITCQVVENRLRPQFKNDSNYPFTVIYFRADNGMPLKWELFGTPSRMDKVIKVNKLSKIDGVWTIARATVQDLTRKGRLTLSLQRATYNPHFKEQWFSEEYLRENSK